MKRLFSASFLLLAVCALPLLARADDATRYSNVRLDGAIAGDNITLTLRLSLDNLAKNGRLRIVNGQVAPLTFKLPRHVELRREGESLAIVNTASGWFAGQASGELEVTLGARATSIGDWRSTHVQIPLAPIRPVSISGDRSDLEVRISGARDIRHEAVKGGSRTTGFLGQESDIELSWKTAVRELDAAAMASCDVTAVATVGSGALRLKSICRYQIAQGALSELSFDVRDTTITQVGGSDIQDWRVDTSDPKAPKLRVTLGRPQRESYTLTVDGEHPLPALPCTLGLPVIVPERLIRAGGTLLVGTDSAVKIQPGGISGLTQTDPAAFLHDQALALPQRSVFTYQYAMMPYTLNLALEDIVTALDAEIGLVATVAEGELGVDANVQVEVRDAPAREIRLFMDADSKWTVAAVNGPQVAESDVDIRSVEGGREIIVPFRQPVSNTVLLHVRLEQPFGAARNGFTLPRVTVPAARTQRGYIVVAAAKGLRIVPRTSSELRDVHTASTPVRVEGAQLAYRFRDAAWKLDVGVERAKAAIHSEVFHLVSLGEGVMYVSAAITCHISGAPIQNLQFRVPAGIPAIDVIGAGIDSWARSNDVCNVQLANRTSGDYTLLITYDQPLNYRGAELRVGDIETMGTDSEMGYIAVATSAGLKLQEQEQLPQALIRIGRDELPPGYAATVTAPVIGAYKYVRQPHAATLRVTPLDTERVIDQVVDYLALSSRIGRDGESVTRALYCVKNASRQYLTVKLPPDASLWTVRQTTDGQARDLACQQSSSLLLVPVARPRDPNEAVSIEITYAQPGLHGAHRLRLTGPVLPETPTTYASWEVTSGDKLALVDAGGNMTPSETNPLSRLLPHSGSAWHFYRTANLAGDEPLSVTGLLVPAWLSGGSASVLIVALGAALLLLVVSFARRRPLWWALTATAIGVAALQTAQGWMVVLVAALIAVPTLLIMALARVLARRKRRTPAAPAVSETPDEPPAPFEPEAPQNGFADVRLLLSALAAGLAMAAVAGGKPQIAQRQGLNSEPAALPAIRVQRLEVAVQAPSLLSRAERTAAVGWRLQVQDAAPGRYRLLGAQSVLASAQVPSGLSLEPAEEGCVLEVRKAGSYDFSIRTLEPVTEREGRFDLPLMLPPSLMNHFTLAVPAADMEILCGQAILLTSSNVTSETRAEGVLDTVQNVTLSWKPRTRVARLEQTVVYCDVDSVAFARAGIVDISTRANYQVVQGEVRELRLKMPSGVSVTSVTAPSLATWSLDPATRELVALLARPVSGAFALELSMQAPCGGLPYGATLGVPAVENVQRQRGQFALAAPESILLRLGESKSNEVEGVVAVNTSDFPVSQNAAVCAAVADSPLRRAFRYDDPAKVKIALQAEPVQPELRVSEAGSFSIGDERDVLSTLLDLTVAKAGVFSVRLLPPEGYDIETLTGPDVSHWDDTRRTGRGVEVFFRRRVLGNTTLNLVFTRQQRGIPERIDVPRVGIQDATRHTGRMAVAAERGVRLTVDEQQAVSLRKPEAGEKVQPAAVTFDILRPAWQVTLRTQVMAPTLKPEFLHRVELAEGMLQHRVYLRYRIENAGIKIFKVRLPVKEATLSVSGRNIARVMPLDGDPEAGSGRVWQVELHGKVEDNYALTCFYQQPYDPASGGVVVQAFDPLGVARQTAWLVITGGGRVQVEPRGEAVGLKAEDARSLPDTFGAGDLSGALRCYRALRNDYRCDLSVVRHGAADVLPASVEKVQFVTVLSSSGKLLTQAMLNLKVGDLRFLKVQLPTADSVLWAALVNGAEVNASRDGTLVNVPLENLTADKSTAVTLVYADRMAGRSLSGRRTLLAPRFPDVPLREISWDFFVPSEYRHTFVAGDFDKAEAELALRHFEKADYEDYNKRLQSSSIGIAKQNLKDIGGLLDSGRQREAQQALQVAVNASQADQSLNEDARIQYRNVVKQQVKMGLVNRREELRRDNNIFDEQAPQTREGFNGGNFSQSFVSQVEEQLAPADRAALDRVSQRIVDQQAAAAGQGTAINIAMPEHGRQLRFHRSLQSEKGGPLQVVLVFERPSLAARLLAFWPVAPAFLLLWGLLKLALGRKQAYGG